MAKYLAYVSVFFGLKYTDGETGYTKIKNKYQLISIFKDKKV